MNKLIVGIITIYITFLSNLSFCNEKEMLLYEFSGKLLDRTQIYDFFCELSASPIKHNERSFVNPEFSFLLSYFPLTFTLPEDVSFNGDQIRFTLRINNETYSIDPDVSQRRFRFDELDFTNQHFDIAKIVIPIFLKQFHHNFFQEGTTLYRSKPYTFDIFENINHFNLIKANSNDAAFIETFNKSNGQKYENNTSSYDHIDSFLRFCHGQSAVKIMNNNYTLFYQIIRKDFVNREKYLNSDICFIENPKAAMISLFYNDNAFSLELYNKINKLLMKNDSLNIEDSIKRYAENRFNKKKVSLIMEDIQLLGSILQDAIKKNVSPEELMNRQNTHFTILRLLRSFFIHNDTQDILNKCNNINNLYDFYLSNIDYKFEREIFMWSLADHYLPREQSNNEEWPKYLLNYVNSID
jgi:hypothetical protein